MKVSKVLSTSAALVGSSSKLLFLVRMAEATTDAEHSNRKRAARLSSKQKNLGILAHKSEGGVRGDEVEFGIRELQSPNACCSTSMGAECATANQACYDCVQGVDSLCSSSLWDGACVCEAAGGISYFDGTSCATVCASNYCPPSVCCGDPEPVCDPNPPFNEDVSTCPEDCATATTTTTTTTAPPGPVVECGGDDDTYEFEAPSFKIEVTVKCDGDVGGGVLLFEAPEGRGEPTGVLKLDTAGQGGGGFEFTGCGMTFNMYAQKFEAKCVTEFGTWEVEAKITPLN
jgi:hypothetical protein